MRLQDKNIYCLLRFCAKAVISGRVLGMLFVFCLFPLLTSCSKEKDPTLQEIHKSIIGTWLDVTERAEDSPLNGKTVYINEFDIGEGSPDGSLGYRLAQTADGELCMVMMYRRDGDPSTLMHVDLEGDVMTFREYEFNNTVSMATTSKPTLVREFN